MCHQLLSVILSIKRGMSITGAYIYIYIDKNEEKKKEEEEKILFNFLKLLYYL